MGKLLKPYYEEFPVILVEKSAEANISHPYEDYYLWYQFHQEHLISTFDDYLNEKLAVTDKAEAKIILEDFNMKVEKNNFPILEFEPSRKRISKILIVPDLGRIVMHDRGVHPKTGVNYRAGRGGYHWEIVE
ncbi:MAG: hypothetical protein IIB08_00725 [Bacteroidetes bacterium]|nr:hypothetical protein [Bacteroidota bacterium]